MADITIGTNTFKAMVDVATASEYISGSISENADTWLAGTEDFQGRTIVSAQRIFDRLNWQGTKTDEAQDNSWPRDGVEGVTDGTTPAGVINGLLELVILITGDTELANFSNSGSNVKRAKGGEAEVWFFRNTQDGASPLPTAVWEWIKSYMAGGEGIGAVDFGTYSSEGFVSVFDDESSMTRSEGLM